MNDFEAELVVTFHRPEDEPAFKEDDVNILFETKDYNTHLDECAIGYADGANRNELECWLSHCLYDYLHVPWTTLLRVVWFWVDAKVWLQHDSRRGDTQGAESTTA